MSDKSRARAVQRACDVPYQRALQLVAQHDKEAREFARAQSVPLTKATVAVVAFGLGIVPAETERVGHGAFDSARATDGNTGDQR